MTDFKNKQILITGGTGFIGRQFCEAILAEGARVIFYTRRGGQLPDWLACHSLMVSQVDDFEKIASQQRIDIVINLAGESIAQGRWSARRKHLLMQSRVDTTAALTQLIQRLHCQPYVISASAVGYYGSHGDDVVTESSKATAGFSHDLCHQWEAGLLPLEEGSELSVAKLRLGVVLGNSGGAWQQFRNPLRLKVSPIYGSGQQWLPWVHIDDVVGAMRWLCERQLSGTFNVSAPNPLTYHAFSSALARHFSAIVCPRLPSALIKVLFGQMGDELFLSSLRVEPAALEKNGFEFRYKTLEAALPLLRL